MTKMGTKCLLLLTRYEMVVTGYEMTKNGYEMVQSELLAQSKIRSRGLKLFSC